MPLHVSCPMCAKLIILHDSMRGREVTCPHCKKPIKIPNASPPKTAPEKKEAVQAVRAVKRPPAQPVDKQKGREAISASPPLKAKDANAVSRTPLRKDRADAAPRGGSPQKPAPAEVTSPRKRSQISKPAGLPLGTIIGGGAAGLALIIAVIVVVILMKGGGADPIAQANNDPEKNNDVKDAQKGTAKDTNREVIPLVKLPDHLADEGVQRVKQATAYLKVTTTTGQVAEGSGFLAVEAGIVMTNAHVLGMLSPNSRPPTKVDVVLHSGESNELTLAGEVLGVDRTNDLAVVRVQGNLPAPLQLELGHVPIETQKVYIFGFPFGAELGKSITVSTSSISSLRKGASGALEQIQVNGGMHPGNSGGPVVNAAGRLVGVSVAGIRGTQINFAIPADYVKLLLDGRILDAKQSEPYLNDGQARVPVQYTCLDPFKRVKELKVEVWTGNPGPERAFSLNKQPQAAAGDGPRATHTLKYENGVASGEVPLPTLAAGQVAWLQPVLVSSTGMTQWGAARATEADLAPLDRKPANLLLNFSAHKERTTRLKLSQSITIIKGKSKSVSADRTELDFLEAIFPVPKGFAVKLQFGPPQVSIEEDGRKLPMDPRIADILRRIPPTFVVDASNRLLERGGINLGPQVDFRVREFTNDFFNGICNAFEATNLEMPNRVVQPLETWNARMAMLMKQGKKVEVVDLALACAYEGTRMRKGRSEAFITVTGLVKGRGPAKSNVDGKVAGKFAFDLADGYIAQAKLAIVSEADLLGGELQLVGAFDIDLTRAPGNALKLEIPKHEQPLPPVKGDIVVQNNGALGPTDPFDVELRERGSRAKLVQVQLEAGKKYSIQLNSAQFDCYLRLLDSNGKILAVDDDGGGGLNSRIDYTPTVSGLHGIVVTSFDGKMGQFQLTVLALK